MVAQIIDCWAPNIGRSGDNGVPPNHGKGIQGFSPESVLKIWLPNGKFYSCLDEILTFKSLQVVAYKNVSVFILLNIDIFPINERIKEHQRARVPFLLFDFYKGPLLALAIPHVDRERSSFYVTFLLKYFNMNSNYSFFFIQN